jgi:hypothetical protein
MAKIRVTRTIVIEGEEEWVRKVLCASLVSTERPTYIATRYSDDMPKGSITETDRKEEKV